MTDYATEGAVWSNPHNITYAWGDATTTSYSSSQSFTGAITGAYETLVQQAMAAWSAVANVTFTLVASTAGADIDFGWMNFITAGQLGTTNYAYYPDGTGKTVFLAGMFVGFEDPSIRAVGSDQTSFYSGYNTTLYQIMEHEIGHSLGLAHSTNPYTLMYPTLGLNNPGISQLDITGMQTLYGAPGSGTPTPPTTTISTIAISADSNVPGDFVTNVASQTVTATLSAALATGETLMASANGGATWTNVTASVAGQKLTWTGVTLAGASSIMLKVTNANGDGTVATQAYTLETTAPTTTATSVHISADSNVVGDFVTNVANQTITATLTASLATGERLMGSTNGGTSWTDVTGMVSGTAVTWTAATLSGTSAIQFRVMDLAGNYGTTTTQTYTLDVTAPTTAAGNIHISADSNVAGDFVTNVASQTITATLTALLATGERLMGTTNGGATWTDVTGMASGTTLTWTGATLSGSNSIQLRVMDLAGNYGITATQSYTLDAVAPTTTAGNIHISADSNLPGDFVTNVASQTVTATLSALLAVGDRLMGTTNGGTTWTDVTGSVLGTAVTWIGATLSGSSSIQFRVIDLAGNAGSVTGHPYTLDTTAPTTTAGNIHISADSNVAGDFVTNVASQTITATLSGALAGGDKLMGTTDGGATWTDVTAMASGTSVTWTGATLSALGVIAFRVTDLAGNVGPTSSQPYTLDATAPLAPTAALSPASDSGIRGDLLTNVTTPTVTGIAEANSTVRLLDTNGTTVLGMATAGATRIFSITSAALAGGTHRLTITATDLAGNVSAASNPLNLTIDATPPATPAAPALAAGSDTGTPGDGITSVATPTLTGTAETGATVTLYDTDGITVLGTAIAAGNGSYSISTTTLRDGIHLVTAKATDAAGNASTASAARTLAIDTSTPAETVSGIVVATDTNGTTQTVTGTVNRNLAAGETLLGSTDAGQTWTNVSTALAGSAIRWTGLALGTSGTIEFRVTNAAGTTGAPSTQAYAPPGITIPPVTTPVVTTPVVTTPPTTTTIADPPAVTTATDPTTPVTGSPGDTVPQPTPASNVVYRFFDSTHGTQFLTSNAGERDTIIATRPDLAYEGKAMGTVDADPTNPNVATVFRFFDGSNGTHFFTTSAGERDQILATRHDMVLEQANMFEHATRLDGDVAVYRFFETTDGSHFFTSNQGEIATVSQARPDMVAEGVSFYAPKV